MDFVNERDDMRSMKAAFALLAVTGALTGGGVAIASAATTSGSTGSSSSTGSSGSTSTMPVAGASGSTSTTHSGASCPNM